MAAQTAATTFTNAIDASTKQVEDVQAALLNTVKQSALTSIDIYEKSVSTILDLQKKFIVTTDIPAIDDLIAAQTKLVGDVNAAGLSVARSVFA